MCHDVFALYGNAPSGHGHLRIFFALLRVWSFTHYFVGFHNQPCVMSRSYPQKFRRHLASMENGRGIELLPSYIQPNLKTVLGAPPSQPPFYVNCAASSPSRSMFVLDELGNIFVNAERLHADW